MLLIACVDDKMGMAFNGRRQSRDSVVCEDIVKETQGRTVGMDERSRRLFEGMDIAIADDPQNAECYFLEFSAPSEFSRKPEHIILYRWNRHYPSDVKFDLPMDGYKLTDSAEFAGSSHEKITKEVYAYEK